MVNNNSNEVMRTQVSESECSLPDNIPEYNTYHGTSEDVSESHLSTNSTDVYKIPTLVSERINHEEAVYRKRPCSAVDDAEINNKVMRLRDRKCICINNENNAQIFPSFEGKCTSESITPLQIHISGVYGSTNGYEQSLEFHPINVRSYEGNLENVPTAEKHENRYIGNSVIEIINDDTETENSGQEGSPFIHIESNDSKSMTEKQFHRKYNKRRRKITRSITCNLHPVIVVWCPLEQLRPDFIVTTLGKYDDDLEVRDRWSFPSLTSSVGVWGGAIAEFFDEETALAAAKDLSQQSKHVKILQLSWLFDEFVNAEVCHPLYHKGTTRIIASGRRCAADDDLTKESICSMETMFRQCGDVRDIKFYLDQDESETVCEVIYTFVSQAYLAKFLLTGMCFKPVLSLCIEVEETRKEKEISKAVKRNIREFLEESMCL